MKRAVIDVGSNSIRLLIEGNTHKLINTTQLAEGLAISDRLNHNAMKRSAKAIKSFYDIALEQKVDSIHVFATEAVRSAKNKEQFIQMMKSDYDIDLIVLEPEVEALSGYLGAGLSEKIAIIDIGGASTEIIVGENNSINYVKSLPIGIVKLRDICGSFNISKLDKYIKEKIIDYGKIPEVDNGVVIGGTASTIVSILLEGYKYEKIHHYKLNRDEMKKVMNIIINAKDKDKIKGLPKMRTTVIVGGLILLDNIMQMLKLNEIIVSEQDNMEGYLKYLDM